MDRMTALRVFREVAERGGFAAAGRRLGLSPPAVSKNIAELEAHLGVRLVNRTTRRMALTEDGAIYLEHVGRALDDLADAEQALSTGTAEPRGTLRVSAPVSVTLTRLSAEIPRFLSRHPKLALDLDLDDRQVDLVRDGFDLAIRGTAHLADSSLVARRLATMPKVVCAAPAYFERAGRPACPADLGAHNCLRFSLATDSRHWEFHRAGQVERITLDGRYAATSSLAVRDALLVGFGLSLIPRLYVEADLAQGRLEAVLDDWSTPETTLYGIFPSRRYVAPKVRVFLEFLAEVFGSRPIGR